MTILAQGQLSTSPQVLYQNTSNSVIKVKTIIIHNPTTSESGYNIYLVPPNDSDGSVGTAVNENQLLAGFDGGGVNSKLEPSETREHSPALFYQIPDDNYSIQGKAELSNSVNYWILGVVE
jgi:hypothetical protein